MAFNMFNSTATPTEIAAFKEYMDELKREQYYKNNDLNTATNMTHNLSPWGNLGIALGTIGGNLAARYFNDQYQKQLLNQKGYQDFINALNSTPSAINQFSPTQNSAANLIQTPPNPALLATENNTATSPTNTAPSASLFMKDNPSYDWRNQNYLSNNQPYFKPTYPNGMPKNYLTAYSAFR